MDQTPTQEVDLVLRAGADPVSLSNAMREAVTAVDHEQPLFDGTRACHELASKLGHLLCRQKSSQEPGTGCLMEGVSPQ
jgi:hypothetical protein